MSYYISSPPPVNYLYPLMCNSIIGFFNSGSTLLQGQQAKLVYLVTFKVEWADELVTPWYLYHIVCVIICRPVGLNDSKVHIHCKRGFFK